MAGVKFTPESAQRIADVVKQVEGTLPTTSYHKHGTRENPTRQLWAKLTDFDDSTREYDWTAVQFDDSYGNSTNSDWGESATYGPAIEANDLPALIGSIVLLKKVQGYPYWVFERSNGLFARLTDCDSNGKYDWTALSPDSGGGFTVDSDWGQGSVADDNYAVELNGLKTPSSIMSTLAHNVFLVPAITEPYFVFQGPVEVSSYLGQLTADLDEADSTCTVDNLIPIGFGSSRRVDASTSITADNIHNGSGANNNYVYIVHDQTSDTWYAITGDCAPAE